MILSTQPNFFKSSLNVNKGLSFKKHGDQVLISMVNLMMNSKDLVSISMSQCINMLESEFFPTIKLILFVQSYQTASEQDIRSLRTIKSGVILDSLERIFKISFMPNVISVQPSVSDHGQQLGVKNQNSSQEMILICPSGRPIKFLVQIYSRLPFLPILLHKPDLW